MFLGQNVDTMTEYGATAGQITNYISALRNKIAQEGVKDNGVGTTDRVSVVNEDKNGLTFFRDPLSSIMLVRIFFPMGFNGYFK